MQILGSTGSLAACPSPHSPSYSWLGRASLGSHSRATVKQSLLGKPLRFRGSVPGWNVPGDMWKADSAPHPWDMPGSQGTAVTIAAAVSPWQKDSCAIMLPLGCVLYISSTDLPREEVLQEGDNRLKSVLPTDNGEVTVLPAGRHEFPFTFQLPE